MYAVMKTGGKQYKVSEGNILKVEKLEAEVGDKITFENILFLTDGEGNVKVGDPNVSEAKVIAEVIEQGREKKVVVYKYKKRKNYHKKQGHRQPFTKIKIEKIEG
ncbi:MAG TPA: 50S ribosomal protein L21 [Syntrophomonadaceae bacterium]|jgi:large subunit ribosomal protein L21|nr:50S ribosomal protein L21 [Syntrophomonadaceae bacterium]HRX20657.1 50S ribosomal protein L21 [Syntrophomonadaceae bacterium]